MNHHGTGARICVMLSAVAVCVLRVFAAVLEETPQRLTVRTAGCELAVDRGTGHWLWLRDAASGRVLIQPGAEARWTALHQGGAWAAPADWRLADFRWESTPGDAVLVTVQRSDAWQVLCRTRFRDAADTIVRTFELTPLNPQDVVRGVRFELPGVCGPGGEDARYSLLANWPPHDCRMRDLVAGRTVQESFGGNAGHMVLVHGAEASLGLALLWVCESERVSLRAVEGRQEVSVQADVQAAWRPEVGHGEPFGSQIIRMTRGSWQESLAQAREMFAAVDLTPPAGTAALARRAIIYSAHPGGTIGSGFRDVGGFRAFSAYLPELERLGINTLWLMPIWKGQVYAPSHYDQLDEYLGSETDLKTLVDEAHRRGIRVLGDLIPHGPLDVSGLHREHPDWITRTDEGDMRYWWGCLACDYAHPGWQAYMGQHALDWVERVGLDGYRVDCAGGGLWNWQPVHGNRPSMSGFHGGIGVLRAAREHMIRAKADVLLLAEAASPALYRAADLTYDWPLCNTIFREFPRMASQDFVRDLSTWLHREQFWCPRGAALMRYLENHDTTRARLVYGPGPERALMALCALLPGAPMVYHFQEIGMAPWLRELFALRRAIPVLVDGGADFASVRVDHPNVMVFRRHGEEGQQVIAAINFSQERISTTLEMPPELAQDLRFHVPRLSAGHVETAVGDGRLLRQRRLTLAPFGAVVLVPREFGDEDAEPRAAAGPSAALEPALATSTGLPIIAVSGGEESVRVTATGEGRRRLWLGADALNAESAPAPPAVALAQGWEVHRDAPELPVSWRTRCRAEDRAVAVTTQLTPRTAVDRVLGTWREVMRLPGNAVEWVVFTREGVLHDWVTVRRSSDRMYRRRYLNGVGHCLWESRQIGLSMAAPVVAARLSSGHWLAVRFHDDGLPPDNILLKERDGESAGLHLVIDWFDGSRAVSLDAGNPVVLGYRVELLEDDAWQELRRRVETTGIFRSGEVELSFCGSRCELRNPDLRFAFSRYGGGRMYALVPRGAHATFIRDSHIYSDGGIYGMMTQPDGSAVKTHASVREDPESRLDVTRTADGWSLTVEGVLRTHYTGRSVPSPYTRTRVVYTMGSGSEVRVRLGVRVQATMPKAEAFLAQTLHVPPLDTYWVRTPAGKLEGAVDGLTGRLWESRQATLPEEPCLGCAFADGTTLAVEGVDLAHLQNAFLLREDNGRGVVFLAFHDFVPQDILPVWRTIDYRLGVLPGNR